MLFSIKSNILLSSILGFSWWASFPFKMDTLENEIHKKLYLKKNEIKFFKKMWSSAKWHHLKQNENEIRWSKKDAITIPRNKKNTLHILKANFVSQRHIHTKYHLYDSCSLTHFYKQFCILHEFFVRFFTSFARLM